MDTRTAVTLIQDTSGNVIRIRVGDQEVPVMHAGPVVGPGQMNLVLTIKNVDLRYELVSDSGQL